MLTNIEQVLMSSDLHAFPLLVSVAKAIEACGTCGHKGASPRTLLRTAIGRYSKDDSFKQHCKRKFKLPAVLGGILVEDIQ